MGEIDLYILMLFGMCFCSEGITLIIVYVLCILIFAFYEASDFTLK